MATNQQMIADLYRTTDTDSQVLQDPEVAYLVVHHNQVLGAQLVPGLQVEVKELEDGIEAAIRLQEGTIVKKPVHLCFGMFPETGVQRIVLTVNIEKKSKISLLAHCTFPNAVDVQHLMNASITIGEDAEYTYVERHIHGDLGGVKVYPHAVVELESGSKFKTEFELLKGRVGEIYIDYRATCKAYSVLDMTARINGTGDDLIQIKETGYLVGEGARGVLTSRIAVRDHAKAEVYNDLTASAAYTRGHVDCKEIIQGHGVAKAVPIVQVAHPKAYVTHEAAIGSVDSKQLETLMARGLSEDDAVNLIIEGLLS
jgi:Fe-S cluster assembly scaffold protein SufB